MKRYFIITVAALVSLCACTKNEVSVEAQKEISFSVASYVGQTKANPTDYAEQYANVPFGTYAWFYQNGQDAQEFMVDETVSLNRGQSTGKTDAQPVWSPSVTYYWPKSGTIDFISYSPKSISSFVKIDPSNFDFVDYTVADGTDVDVMYADKAAGCTMNKTTYFYNGVPTLFHHALAKLNINIKTAYDEKVLKEGEDETKWAITVKDLSLNDFFNKGSANLDLATDGSWTLPSGNVWTPSGSRVDKDFDLPTDATINKDGKDFVNDYFVLPQDLAAGQTIKIVVDIVTTLPNGKTITETGVVVEAKLGESSIDAWEMNKQISYDLIIVPAKAGDDGEPVAILFDPAVADWEDATASGITI